MILEAFFQAEMPGVKEVTLHLASGANRTVNCQVALGEDVDTSGITVLSRPTRILTQTEAVLGDVRRGDSVTMDGTEFTASHDAIPQEVHGLYSVELK